MVAPILGNVAVLAGLALVAVELRQNRQNMDAGVQLALSSAYQEIWGRAIENPQFAGVIATAFTTPDSLGMEEGIQIVNWMAEWTAVIFATWELQRAGVIPEATWRLHANNFTLFFASPWFRETFFGQFNDSYPREFMDEIRAMADRMEPIGPMHQPQGQSAPR